MVSNSEKNEKSLAEFVVIVTLVGIMMAIFINYFTKNKSQFIHAGFVAVAQNFKTKVNAVHAQWLMEKKPNTVYLASQNKQKKQAVPVNKSGWIDAPQQQLVCDAIWQLVMEVPMSSMSFSVSAVEVLTLVGKHQEEQNHVETSRCRYTLADGSYFQYNRTQGKVTKVMALN